MSRHLEGDVLQDEVGLLFIGEGAFENKHEG